MPNLKQRKVALMGFRSVGKSSLAIQFVENQFPDHYEPTIENTFKKKVSVSGSEYELLIVDTAGQDEYSRFPTEYTVDIYGYVLVYSIDSSRSFKICNIIYEKLVDVVGVDQCSVPIVLVGNKSDLHMERQVPMEQGRKLAEQMKGVFLETSAKENQGVADIFTRVIAEMERGDGDLPDNKKCRIS